MALALRNKVSDISKVVLVVLMNQDPIADRLDPLSPINMGPVKGSGHNTPCDYRTRADTLQIANDQSID